MRMVLRTVNYEQHRVWAPRQVYDNYGFCDTHNVYYQNGEQDTKSKETCYRYHNHVFYTNRRYFIQVTRAIAS